jgi:hypothetical protein
VQLLVAVLMALFAAVPPVRPPSPMAVLQHRIDSVTDRVQVAIAQRARARTQDEKRRADAALVDLRLELADLSDRVHALQSPR